MPILDLLVNGTRRQVEAGAQESLLSVLRNEVGLTGAKYGCGEGECGACTVLMDGRPTRACVTPASAIGAKTAVTTIEGIADGERLHPMQQAFLDADAMQCGYCTPGMIVEAVALLRRNPHPDDAAIVEAMQAHVCRCCTYPRIVRAIREAARAAAGKRT